MRRRFASLLVMTLAFSGMATLPTLPAVVLYAGCVLVLLRIRRPLDMLTDPPALLVRSRATH